MDADSASEHRSEMKLWLVRACILVCGLHLLSARHALAGDTIETFRVMTYNIHHAEGMDHKVDVKRISDLILKNHADIVALQEVDKGVERTQRRDFPEELAALTGMSAVFSNNYSFQGGEYGNAVLTRFPIRSRANFHFQMPPKLEPRGMLEVRLDVHGHDLVLFATHLDQRHEDAARVSSVKEIDNETKRFAGMAILLCGDLNDSPTSREHQLLSKLFEDTWLKAGEGDGFTIPSTQPRKRIDYIWISKEPAGEFVPVKEWVPESLASDHRPVVAEFQIRNGG